MEYSSWSRRADRPQKMVYIRKESLMPMPRPCKLLSRPPLPTAGSKRLISCKLRLSRLAVAFLPVSASSLFIDIRRFVLSPLRHRIRVRRASTLASSCKLQTPASPQSPGIPPQYSNALVSALKPKRSIRSPGKFYSYRPVRGMTHRLAYSCCCCCCCCSSRSLT